jgi:hypothetical protein
MWKLVYYFTTNLFITSLLTTNLFITSLLTTNLLTTQQSFYDLIEIPLTIKLF